MTGAKYTSEHCYRTAHFKCLTAGPHFLDDEWHKEALGIDGLWGNRGNSYSLGAAGKSHKRYCKSLPNGAVGPIRSSSCSCRLGRALKAGLA